MYGLAGSHVLDLHFKVRRVVRASWNWESWSEGSAVWRWRAGKCEGRKFKKYLQMGKWSKNFKENVNIKPVPPVPLSHRVSPPRNHPHPPPHIIIFVLSWKSLAEDCLTRIDPFDKMDSWIRDPHNDILIHILIVHHWWAITLLVPTDGFDQSLMPMTTMMISVCMNVCQLECGWYW
jgi:hypothetical protein